LKDNKDDGGGDKSSNDSGDSEVDITKVSRHGALLCFLAEGILDTNPNIPLRFSIPWSR
jgi:hypothetical protein